MEGIGTRRRSLRSLLVAIAVGLGAMSVWFLLAGAGAERVSEQIADLRTEARETGTQVASAGASEDARTSAESAVVDLDKSKASTVVLEGVLRTRTGESPGRCTMIVNHPHRDHLDAVDRGRASVQHFPDKQGRFAIALSSPPFVDTAVVTVTGGPEGDSTLFHSVVGIGSGHAIEVLSPAEIRQAAIRGRLLIEGNPVAGGDMVLRSASGRPLSVQWGFAGVELDVHLRRLREDLDRVVGPVRLFLQDDTGLHWEQEFATVAVFRDALQMGIPVAAKNVTLEFDAVGRQIDGLRLGSCRNDDFAKDRVVSGAKSIVRLAPGRYFFELVCDNGAAHGVGSFAFDGSAASIRLACDAWEPGPACVDVMVRGSDARGIAKASVRMRRRSESGDALPTVVHEQSTDESGLARVAGLSAGAYDLEVAHEEHARQSMRIRVAGAPEPQLAEVTMQQGSTVLLDFVQSRGQMATRASGIAYRPLGRAWWTPVEVGPGSDLVAEGVPTGEAEFLAVADAHCGVAPCAVQGPRCRASIVLEDVQMRTVRLVDERGAAAQQVTATLELPGASGDWPVHVWPMEADGKVAYFTLGIDGEKFVVRHIGRTAMALDPKFVPDVLTVVGGGVPASK